MTEFTMKHWILEGHEPVPVDLITWAKWFETGDRRVAYTDGDGYNVSTVFLGIDHRFGAAGPPLLFETMVFGGTHDQDQLRYATWDEAVAGHEASVELCREDAAKGRGHDAG